MKKNIVGSDADSVYRSAEDQTQRVQSIDHVALPPQMFMEGSSPDGASDGASDSASQSMLEREMETVRGC